VGVHSLAVEYLKSRLPKDGVSNVAVAGLGSIGRRVLELLDRDPSISVTAFNRTTAKLGKRKIVPLSSLPARLGGLDAVVVCTGATEPVIETAALKKSKTAGGLLIVDIGIPEQVERTHVKGVTIAGLDDLVKYHSNRCESADPVADAGLERLTAEALEEFRFYCRREAFTEIIDTMQKNHGVLVHKDIPRVIARMLDGVPGELRTGLERELRTLITGYTRGMFKTIREASARTGGGSHG
jgi:glutamyl-tRNA reductase